MLRTHLYIYDCKFSLIFCLPLRLFSSYTKVVCLARVPRKKRTISGLRKCSRIAIRNKVLLIRRKTASEEVSAFDSDKYKKPRSNRGFCRCILFVRVFV